MVYVYWSICSLKSGKVTNYLCVSCTLHNIWDIKSTLSNVANYLNSWSTELRIFIGRFDSLFTYEIYLCVCVCVCVFATNIYCSYTFAINIYLLFMYNNELLYKYAFFTFWFHHSYHSLKIHLLPLILINFNLFSFKITFQSILLVNLARISFMMWKYLWLFSPKQVT